MLKRLTSRWHTALANAVLAAIYFGAGSFGLSLAFVHPSVSPVWPPSGIALAAILLWGYRLWPGIFLGAFLLNVASIATPPVAIGIAIGNTLEAVVGAWLVFRYANGPRAFEQAANIVKFILFGVVLNTTLAAFCGVGSLSLGGFALWNEFSTLWITWWLGDMIGALILAPFMVIWLTQPAPTFQTARVLEAGALLVMLVSISAIIFLRHISSGLEYLAVPLLLWAAFRFGPRGAVTASFIVSAIAVLGTLQEVGPFAGAEINEALLSLLVFMGTITGTTLVLAAVVAERSRAAEAAHQKGAQLRLITDTASIMLSQCSSDKRFRFVNRAYAERFGLTPDDITGKPISEILGTEAYETIRPYVEGVLRGETVEYEVEVPYERIGRRFMRIGYVPEKDAQGEVTGWVAAISDITDQKKAEQALRDSEQRCQALIDNSTAVIYVKDLEGRYILINSRHEELFGVSKLDIPGKTDFDLFPTDAAQRFRENDLKVIGTNHPVEFEEVVPHQDGMRTYISIKFPLTDALGRTYGVAGISTDITQRKQIEQTLRQRTRSLEIVNRVGGALAGELELNRVVQTVTDAGREICGAQFGALFYNVKDERGEFYKLYTLSGASGEAFEQFPMPRNTDLFDATCRGAGAIRIGDVLSDPRYGKNPPYYGMPPGHLPVRSYLAVPVVSRSGEVLGGLFFGHPEADVFTAEAEAIISAVTAQAAIAIDNANLYKTVRQRAEEFGKLIDTAPVGIAVATDPDCKFIGKASTALPLLFSANSFERVKTTAFLSGRSYIPNTGPLLHRSRQ